MDDAATGIICTRDCSHGSVICGQAQRGRWAVEETLKVEGRSYGRVRQRTGPNDQSGKKTLTPNRFFVVFRISKNSLVYNG